MRLRYNQLKYYFHVWKSFLECYRVHLKRIRHKKKSSYNRNVKEAIKASFQLSIIANAFAKKKTYVIDFFPLIIIGGNFRLQKKCMHLKSASRVTFKLLIIVSLIQVLHTVSHFDMCTERKCHFLKWYSDIKRGNISTHILAAQKYLFSFSFFKLCKDNFL